MKLAAAKSAGWTLIEAASAQSLLLVTFLVLARLLTPADYGLMAFATTIISVPQFILSNGLIPVLVSKADLSDDDISTGFWVSLGLGCLLTLLVLVCAGPIAAAVGNPLLGPVLRWSSLQFIFMALGNVPTALYQRRLQFRVFALRSVVSFIGGGGVGITLALHGEGVWSLVANLLVQSIIAGTMLWAGLGWHPRLRFSRASFGEMQRNIRHTIAGNILASVTARIDMLIIGAVNAEMLGYYYFVQRLLLTISVGTTVPISNVALPVLSKLRGDDEQLTDKVSFLLWTAQVLWMPIVAGLGAVAPVLVPNVFGAAWTPSAPLMQIIALTAFTACLYQFTYPVLLTKDRANLYPRLTMAQLVITAGLLLAASQIGLLAIGWAYVAASALTAAMHVLVLRHVLGASAPQLLRRSASVGVATVCMVLGVVALGRALDGASPWLTIALEIGCGALVFVAAMLVVSRADSLRLVATVLQLAPSRIVALVPRRLIVMTGARA